MASNGSAGDSNQSTSRNVNGHCDDLRDRANSSNDGAEANQTSAADEQRPDASASSHRVRHSHSQHSAIARTQPLSPTQLRVYRVNRNTHQAQQNAPQQPASPSRLAEIAQNAVRENEPSTSRQDQGQNQDGGEEQNEVSPPLVQRENQPTIRLIRLPFNSPQARLRSGRSLVKSYVRFLNQTSRNVNLLWVNYEGERIRYKTLRPNQFVDVNTFVGHPWIFRDADTGDKLVVQLREVYEPVGYNASEDSSRRVVKISIPVYRLQERCMQVVRDLVPPELVNQLEIPQILRDELQQLVSTKVRSVGNVIQPGTLR